MPSFFLTWFYLHAIICRNKMKNFRNGSSEGDKEMTSIMKKAAGFIKGQTVLAVSLAAAVISMFIVPPDREYIEYIDLPVLILLFCLMGVVAGLRSAGVFERLTDALLRFAHGSRILCFILMNICFFTSMLVTNDVALITFVPLTLMLYAGGADRVNCIITVVIQTAAANLGSMMTPIGNPQNLYLYTEYDLTMGDFISTLLPVGIASYILLSLCCLLVKNEKMEVRRTEIKELPVKKLIVLSLLFAVCLLTVLRIIPHWLCLCIVCAGLLIEWRLFTKIDYALLLTFVCFFVFVGNMGRIEAVSDALSTLMEGRELIVSALVSQVISNVPAAVMLSAFTENAHALLQGVNIGGLGTPVASLASLISYQIYARSENAAKGKYMGIFLLINAAGLAALLSLAVFL